MQSVYWGEYNMIYTVSQKTSHLWLAIIFTHSSITIIFGTNVTEKVGNQNILYFPTSPNKCFCTTWGNRKPGNCNFSLKYCMFLTKSTQNILKYHLVTAELPFTVKMIDGMHHTGHGKHSILLSVTHTLYVNQVCHGIGRCVKDGSCSSSSLEWKSMVSINGISTNVRRYQAHYRWQFFFQEDSIVRATLSNCCSALD